ncbi:unnamed protein product [Sphenostylis stenocarpa]|uniref:Uncharacterized protein n=1 Tax=Sphenostylis stenocarpa TaxID=92480 RepID=A0AA86W2J5_9FABA|nr:unnamed protein product [Sphenostylis stenocarpa]
MEEPSRESQRGGTLSNHVTRVYVRLFDAYDTGDMWCGWVFAESSRKLRIVIWHVAGGLEMLTESDARSRLS